MNSTIYTICIELIDKNEEPIEADTMDYGENYEEIEEIAKQYIKGKADGWGLIDSYKQAARCSDMIEIWIRKDTHGKLPRHRLIGRIK